MISLDALRKYTGAPTGPDADVLLRTMERAALAVVSAHTGRYLGLPAERVEEIAGSGSYTLHLATQPSAVASVAVLPYPGGSPEVLGGADWRLIDGESRLTRLGGVPWYPTLLYRVTYDAGYEDDDTGPDDATLAVLQLVALWWKRRGKEDVTSESIGVYSYSRAASDEGARAILKPLPRRIRV